MSIKLTKISDDEMKLEANIDSSKFDSYIQSCLKNKDLYGRDEILAARELGLNDDPNYQRFILFHAEDLARRTLIKECTKNKIQHGCLAVLDINYILPPQEGKPLCFEIKFPLLDLSKKNKTKKAIPEEDVPGYVLYVVNVPIKRTEDEIKTIFRQAGKIVYFKRMKHSVTGELLDSVIISYSTRNEALDAYLKFSWSYIGGNKAMKIGFKDYDLQMFAWRGDHGGFYNVDKHFFKQGT